MDLLNIDNQTKNLNVLSIHNILSLKNLKRPNLQKTT